MSFLQPSLLYGLIALAIPIIIHLFNFRKTKKVYFSNTQFLKKVKEASTAKLKLKHYLILLSRLLFVFFLVIAFAQPFLPSEKEIDGNQQTYIYVDNSYSMTNNVDESFSALDAALVYTNQLIELYPTNTEYKLLTNNFDASLRTSKSKTEVSELTTELRPGSISRTWEEIFNRINNHDKPAAGSVYWISDFQHALKGEEEIIFDSLFDVNLIPLKFNSESNVHIDSLYLDNPFLIGDEKLKLHVIVRNRGVDEINDLIIKVFADDIQAATASVNIAPNSKEEVVFDLAFDLKGIQKGRISFEEFPVSFDNDFYFTINAGDKINVLEIKDNDDVSDIERVYGNESLFGFQSFNFSNLDYSLIPKADLVIVNQLSSIEPSLAVVLNNYLSDYGSVTVIPSDLPQLSTYRQLQGLGNLSIVDSAQKVSLAAPDFSNPFFANVFEETNPNFVMPSASPVISWGRDRTAILSLNTGVPFLSEIAGAGNLFLFASPMNIEFSTVQSHAIFVPVMYRIAAQSSKNDGRLYYFTDETTVTVDLDTLLADNVVKITNGTQEVIPNQRLSGDQVTMELPRDVVESGFYDVMLNNQKVSALALNYSPLESDLQQASSQELRDKFKGNVDIIEVDNQSAFESEIKKKYIGTPLWKYALLLSLLFLLIEVLFIRFLP